MQVATRKKCVQDNIENLFFYLIHSNNGVHFYFLRSDADNTRLLKENQAKEKWMKAATSIYFVYGIDDFHYASAFSANEESHLIIGQIKGFKRLFRAGCFHCYSFSYFLNHSHEFLLSNNAIKRRKCPKLECIFRKQVLMLYLLSIGHNA